MLNKFIGIGRWSKQVELRYTKNGKAVSSTSIAINDKFNKDNTTFLPVVIWGKQAENAAQFTDKGSLVAIEGKIVTRSYENNEGKRVYVTEVVADSVQFLEPKQNNQSSKPPSNPPTDNRDPFANDGKPIDIDPDDLPF